LVSLHGIQCTHCHKEQAQHSQIFFSLAVNLISFTGIFL